MDYRLFLMRDGHIHGAMELTADNDAAAVSQAQMLRGREAAELWRRARRVHQFAANEPAGDRPAHRAIAPDSRLGRTVAWAMGLQPG